MSTAYFYDYYSKYEKLQYFIEFKKIMNSFRNGKYESYILHFNHQNAYFINKSRKGFFYIKKNDCFLDGMNTRNSFTTAYKAKKNLVKHLISS